MRRSFQRIWISLALAVLCSGCESGRPQPAFSDLHPATGIVTQSGKTVGGGVVTFTPQPDRQEFLINSEVGDDGRFSLSTVRATDSKGERRPGAPAGEYRVTYLPPVKNQTAGNLDPIALPKHTTIQAGSNDLKLELSASR